MTVPSGLAFVPMAMTPSYCATKGAIHSYTRSLSYQHRDISSNEPTEYQLPLETRTALKGRRRGVLALQNARKRSS
jgi:uncharacterized oxidoreductase